MEKMVHTFSGSGIILTLLAIYFVAIIAIGLYYSKKSKGTSDFLTAGRTLTTPYVTASIVATWVGAAVIIGGASETFKYGFQGISWDPFAPVLTMVLASLFFVRRLRKAKYSTLMDFYDSRYNKKVTVVMVILLALSAAAWLSAQLLSLGVVIRVTTGFDATTATLIGAVAIIILVLAGGYWALSRTDMLAFIIIVISLVSIVPYALGSVGGLGSLIENAGNASGLPPFSLFYSTASTADGGHAGFYGYTGLIGIFYAISVYGIVGVGDTASATLMTRALASKDAKTASRSFMLAGPIYLALGLVPIIIGMCVFILRPDFPTEQLDDVLPWFVQNYVPQWLGILLIISIVAAITSTAGDCTLINSALIGKNLFKIFKPDATDEQVLKAIKITSVCFISFALLMALALGTIYRLLVFASAIFFPCIVASFFGGLFTKRCNSTGALASVFGGMASWIVLCFIAYPYIEDMWDTIYAMSFPGFIISVVILFVVSALTQKSDPPKTLIDIEGNDISDSKILGFAAEE